MLQKAAGVSATVGSSGEESGEEESEEEGEEGYGSEEGDIEDIGGTAPKKATRAGGRGLEPASTGPAQPKEMLTPALRASLSKQGYKLIGAHNLHIHEESLGFT
jgi:tRNA wybutosine-synthesizing protein 1